MTLQTKRKRKFKKKVETRMIGAFHIIYMEV